MMLRSRLVLLLSAALLTQGAVAACSSRRGGGGDDDDTHVGDDDDDDTYPDPACDEDADGAEAAGAPCFGDDCADGDPTIAPGVDEGVIELDVVESCTESPSVAVDSTGTVHASCYDESNDAVRYAHLVGGTWESEIVAQRDIGDSCAIAAPNDVVSIAFPDAATGDLVLATLEAGDWSTEVVDSGGCGAFVQMVADSSGRLHLAYRCVGSVRYAYASGLGATWRIETVQTTNPNGSNTGWVDLEVSTAGVVHVVFGSSGEEGVRYYSDATGAFVLDAPWVPNMSGCARVALALHGEEPEIAFEGFFDGILDWRRAVRDGGGWLVDYGVGIADYVGDAGGHVYGCGDYPGFCWDLEGEFVCPRLTEDGFSFYDCSVAVGPDGTVHVLGPDTPSSLSYVAVPVDGVDRDCDGGEL